MSDQIAREHPGFGVPAARPARARAAGVRAGYVDFYGSASIGWVLCGWISLDWDTSVGTPEVELRIGDETVTAEGLLVLHKRPDVETLGRGFVLVVHDESWAGAELTQVTLHSRLGSFILIPSAGVDHLADNGLLDRARAVLAHGVISGNRGRMMGLLSRTEYAGQETLNRLKWPVFMEVDETFLAPPSGLVLRGWFLDPFGTVETIRLRGGGGSYVLRREDWVAIRRPDVMKAVGIPHGAPDETCGYVAYAPEIFTPGDSIYIEIETKDGELAYKNVPQPRRQGLAAIEGILSEIHLRYDELVRGFDSVLGPAIAAINTERMLTRPRVQRIQFGPEVHAPRCSVIVPLYGRIDFMEYQLAFAPQSWGRIDEVIYVLDDPRRTVQAETLSRSCYERFKVPFTLLTLDRNMGYAPANNIGLAAARGKHVCLLNSDVIPKEPRWLDHMIERLEKDDKIGVVGALLLFEDGSIQHEGATFTPLAEFANWRFPLHTNKGRKPSPGGPDLTQAEMVTAACMVMRRVLLRRLEGLDESYVVGDFEDADLCLRIRAQGLSCVVDRRAVLYHLERQSQNEVKNSWRMNLTLFNAWQHQRRWFSDNQAAGK